MRGRTSGQELTILYNGHGDPVFSMENRFGDDADDPAAKIRKAGWAGDFQKALSTIKEHKMDMTSAMLLYTAGARASRSHKIKNPKKKKGGVDENP